MLNLKEILTRIKSGQGSFLPASDSGIDMNQFQQVAKFIVFASENGFIEKCLPQKDSMTGDLRYTGVHVIGGLSFKGEKLLEQNGDVIESTVNDLMGFISPSPQASRKKSDKFGILDSPSLQDQDLLEMSGESGSLFIFLDLDNFKELNTLYTNIVVDEFILSRVQSLINELICDTGYVYAEGGDEITVLLGNCSKRLGLAIAENIRMAINEEVFNIKGHEFHISASLGIAARDHGMPLLKLREEANKAQIAAKERGKNRSCLYYSEQNIVDISVSWNVSG